jgi:hypothetical protein
MANEGKYWSEDVKTKWHPPEGFFDGTSESIAQGLKDASDSHAQAMDRLNFYINRAGSNLTGEDRARLEKSKTMLEDLYKDSGCCN